MSALPGELLNMPIANGHANLRGLGAAVACFAAVAVGSAQEPGQAKAAEVLQKICGACHTPRSALTAGRSRSQWQETIDKMASLGARATDEEFASVLNYLSADQSCASNYGQRKAVALRIWR